MRQPNQAAQRLALAEHLCRSANGTCARRLTAAFEATAADIDSDPTDLDPAEHEWFENGRRSIRPSRVDHWAKVLEELSTVGVDFVTVADDHYPTNLRVVHDRPPFLFVRGEILPADDAAIAVVGTRHASEAGLSAAREAAQEFAVHGITTVSGLANGIDSAAHEAALDAGGRTIAVFGTGIQKVSPERNKDLARKISEHGACVSQFLPDQSGAAWTFPVRNKVTSGLSIGTLVIEAGPTSGAKLQAMDAMRHGKQLFFMAELVRQQEWARELADHPSVIVVESPHEVIDSLRREIERRSAVLV